jgi:GH15 family glucan-1,4-alpha-glucosidase
LPVEGYALIGDGHTAALVGRNGSIDWLCLPRFDSGACFAALLGDEEHGFWRIAPAGTVYRVGSCGGDAMQATAATEAWRRQWSGHCSYQGPWREAVVRSLITLKALSYEPTGGIVAAATTSLPEQIGGVRNWDYRYCWLRDAAFTLDAMLRAGYGEEARAWRDWLQRVVAGDPAQLQIMYGPAGERRLTELELGRLPGYEGSRPVRTGNAASEQVQLDVYGQVMDALHQARLAGMVPDPAGR